ncbi:cysteine hydrolase family protein [Novosphingobium sp. 9]|uniref:cysteine hydrolase family protein n=1 Tax=Novosphingobium sp. 9 TaxID=2025349 RepID=UPI0021B4F08D|nr:isochorismatase family cysteine hydrolase [Novosphingobium sp. 9]
MTSDPPVSPLPALDPRRCALLVIDVQVDFVAPHGFCANAGADVTAMPQAIAAMQRNLHVARSVGMPICFVRLETSAETDSPAMLRHLDRQGRSGGAALCRVGTHGADYWGVSPSPGEHEIVKTRYDAFLETALDAWLRRQGAQVVVICGVSTDCCVDSTARAAFLRDYDVIVLADACAAGSAADHDAALAALGRHAALISDSANFAHCLTAYEENVDV